MKTLHLLASLFLFLNVPLIGKISYNGLYTGTTSDGWDMWLNIASLDRVGLLRYNPNTGEATIGQPILNNDGSFDFQNLTIRYTGQVSENTFQGQITQIGKPTITFSGTRKPDFGPYRELSGYYVGNLYKGSGGIEVLGLVVAADGEVFSFTTIDPTLTIGTVGKGNMLSESSFTLTESSGITRTSNFSLIDRIQMSGSLETSQTTYGFVVYNTLRTNHMINISTRGWVGSGDRVMIAGFIIRPLAKTVLIRGIGPSLASSGVTDTLQDPMTSLIESNGGTTIIKVDNNNWQSNANASAIVASGISPSDPREAALLVRLEAGAYTVTLGGVGDTTGNGLIEVYEVD